MKPTKYTVGFIIYINKVGRTYINKGEQIKYILLYVGHLLTYKNTQQHVSMLNTRIAMRISLTFP